MQLRRYTADDRESLLVGLGVFNAVRAHDSPWMPALTPYRREMQVRCGWDGTPEQHFLVVENGDVVGFAQLEVGEWDNRDFAWTTLGILPAHRRQGLGTQVAERLMTLAREVGCTKFGGHGFDLEATVPFARGVGCELAATEVQRTQYLHELPRGLAQEAYAEAAIASAGYEPVRIAGHAPADLLPAVVRLHTTINDAPTDDLDVEDEVFTPERVRCYERATIESGQRLYRVVARHLGSGVLAGHTVVAVDADRPHLASQHDTAALPDHRGHGLGLLLKADMMLWLADEEPQLERIDTWNAATNDHMIAVNERLGYRETGREMEFQRRL